MASTLEAGDVCGADRLADELVAQAEAAAVPADHREPLLTAARSVADSIVCEPPPPVDEHEGENGKGKGKGKGKKDGDDD